MAGGSGARGYIVEKKQEVGYLAESFFFCDRGIFTGFFMMFTSYDKRI